jgi:hypothetical protein
MKFRLLVVGAMFLAGCASRQSLGPSDTKNQSDNDRFRDLYECEREAAFADAATKSQALDTCMKARGYMQK